MKVTVNQCTSDLIERAIYQCASDLIERAINKLIKQKTIVNKKTQKGNDSLLRSTESEVSSDSGTENRQQCLLKDNELTDKEFDETFPQMKCDIETPMTTGKIVSNTKTILKLETKISAIKGYLDCEISALNDKTNALSAGIDLALKAIEEKLEKTIQNLEQNIDFLQKELTIKNKFTKTIMDTQKDLVNRLFNIQEKASSQNLKHCCYQQNEQNEEPSPQSQQSQRTRFRPSHNRNNQQHHGQNRTD